MIAIIANAIAYDHREHSCGGRTGRRVRSTCPEAYFHPVSCDLINGDDPGAGRIEQVSGALVCISLDALDSNDMPCKHFDYQEQRALVSLDEYERRLPAQRASAMLQRATRLNAGIGIDRWVYDEAEAASRPRLLERAWAFDMCQAFNIGAALALRTFLRERGAYLRLPTGERVGADGIIIVQGSSPPPANGVAVGFIYPCFADRGIGFGRAKLMASSHLWIELRPLGKALGDGTFLDFACHQFGLGQVVAGSAKWYARANQADRADRAQSQARSEPGARLVEPSGTGVARPWALVEPCAAEGGMLQPPKWRASAQTMAALDRESARGCGLSICTCCAGKVFGDAAAARLSRKGEEDPISKLIHANELRGSFQGQIEREVNPGPDGASHQCRPWRTHLIDALRTCSS